MLLIGGSIRVIRETGAIDAFLGGLLERFGDRPKWLLLSMMFTFAMASATIGVAEEYIPFAIILVSLCVAMRLDAIAAIGTLVVGYGIGYGVAFMNPFTLVVAQNVAGLSPLSGFEYRLALVVPFLAVGFHHVWGYVKRIQRDPSASLMAGVVSGESHAEHAYPAMNTTRRWVLGVTVLALLVLIGGIAWQGWYLVELGALFLILAIVTGLIARQGINNTATIFCERRRRADLYGPAHWFRPVHCPAAGRRRGAAYGGQCPGLAPGPAGRRAGGRGHADYSERTEFFHPIGKRSGLRCDAAHGTNRRFGGGFAADFGAGVSVWRWLDEYDCAHESGADGYSGTGGHPLRAVVSFHRAPHAQAAGPGGRGDGCCGVDWLQLRQLLRC